MRETFRQLAGRNLADRFDRVMRDTIEVVYRTDSKSGVPKVEIVDHAHKLFEKISFK